MNHMWRSETMDTLVVYMKDGQRGALRLVDAEDASLSLIFPIKDRSIRVTLIVHSQKGTNNYTTAVKDFMYYQ